MKNNYANFSRAQEVLKFIVESFDRIKNRKDLNTKFLNKCEQILHYMTKRVFIQCLTYIVHLLNLNHVYTFNSKMPFNVFWQNKNS